MKRSRVVAGRFGILLQLGPHQLTACATYGGGQGDLGARKLMVMTFGAVGCAVVIDERPDCRCLGGRPARPVQPLEYPPVIAAREDNLARFYAGGLTVAVDQDRGIGWGDSCRRRCSGSCWTGSRASSGGREP